MGVGFGGAVKLTGESEYRKALKSINQSLKETSSELKTLSASYDRNAGDVDKLADKKRGLNNLLEAEKSKLDILKNEYNRMISVYNDNIKKHSELEKSLKEESDKLKELEATSGKASNEYKVQAGIVNQLATEYQKSEKNIEQNESALSNMRVAINDTNTALEKTSADIEDTGEEAEKAASGGWSIFKSVIADLATDVIRSAVDGLKQLGQSAIDLGKDAIASYADYEQLVGGVETLFGTGGLSAEEYAEKIGVSVEEAGYYMAMYERANEKVLANASEAYKTVGLSANEYMETVTSFSAALISSLGGNTELAASAADQALQDMSDNANKMGSDLSSIQNAYASFARGQYQLLDNLKLGYGGTKEEMERLLEDASKFSGIDYNIENLNDVYSAIHVIQEEMGITGTTAQEAEKTISGSTRMMAASWQNLLTGIASDEGNFGELVDNFVNSVLLAADNLLPRVETTIGGIGELVVELVDKLLPPIIEMIPPLVEKLAPKLISTTEKILQSINGVLPKLLPLVGQALKNLMSLVISSLPELLKLGNELLLSLISGISEALPELVRMLPEIISTITSTLLSPENLSFILQTGIDLIVELVSGISEALPEIIAIIPDVINAITSTLLEPSNVVKIVESAGKIVVELAKGIVNSIEEVKNAIVKIIEGLTSKWQEYYDGFKELGGELISKAAEGIINMKETIGNKASEIGTKIKEKLEAFIDTLKNIGGNLAEGVAQGLLDKINYVKDKVKEFGESIVSGLEDFFGIASPSKLMENRVGKYLAEGVGEGFTEEMRDVSREMQEAVPSAFDIETSVNTTGTAGAGVSSYTELVRAIKEALEEVDVVLDDVKLGKFVNRTVTKAIYQ